MSPLAKRQRIIYGPVDPGPELLSNDNSQDIGQGVDSYMDQDLDSNIH